MTEYVTLPLSARQADARAVTYSALARGTVELEDLWLLSRLAMLDWPHSTSPKWVVAAHVYAAGGVRR